MTKTTTISLNMSAFLWLRREARKHKTSVRAIIREAIDRERERREYLEWLDRVIA